MSDLSPAARLVKLEHAIGVIMIYAERQSAHPTVQNWIALRDILQSLQIISWGEQEAIRRMFANIVPGG